MSSRGTTTSIEIHDSEFDSAIAQRLIAEMNAERAARMPGFSPSGGSTVAGGDFRLPRGVFLVAAREGAALGCGGLRRLSPGVGEIKRLFVSAPARGQGVGRALLCALEDRARSLGYRALRLDNDGGAPAALELFRSQGYRPIEDYNGNAYARHWFEKELER
jgi:GNAT superfamily N-acetyltransferase